MIFIAVSRVSVKPEPSKRWTVVNSSRAETTNMKLFVQGNLTQGDRFKVDFRLAPLSSSVLSEAATVVINLTDPNGHLKTYGIPVVLSQEGQLGLMEPFPEGVANYTGTYRIDAWGIFVSVRYLALRRMVLEERELQYPYGNLFFVGCAIFLGGIGASYLGGKASRHRRTSLKRHLSRHKH